MTLLLALSGGAFCASTALFVDQRGCLSSLVAVVVSGAQVLIALGSIHIAVSGVPFGAMLGAALAVVGAWLWYHSSGKTSITASSVILVAGGSLAAAGIL